MLVRHAWLVVAVVAGAYMVPKATAQDFVARDRAYRHGSLVFAVEENRQTGSLRHRATLAFHEDGRFRHEVKSDAPAMVQGVFAKGTDWYCRQSVVEGVRQTDFKLDLPTGRQVHPFFNPSERPNLATATGLGKVNLAPDGPGCRSGALADGTTVKVFAVEGAARLPDRIERWWKGRRLNAWTYEGELDAGPLVLPRVSRLAVERASSKPSTFVYRFEQADFRANPDEAALRVDWFRPQEEIADRRVEPFVVWQYERLKAAAGERSMTPELLLELSRAQSEAIARGAIDKERKTKAAEAASRRQSSVFLTTFLAGLLVFGGLAAIWARFRR